MVCLSSKHRLDIMLAIAHDKSISIPALSGRCHLLNLKTLHNRNRKQLAGLFGVVEDHTENVNEKDRREGGW